MEDKVIVTIVETVKGWEMDIEISSRIAMKELEPLLLEMLQNKYPSLFHGWKSISIFYKGYIIKPEETLEELGIWDGSRLEIKEGK